MNFLPWPLRRSAFACALTAIVTLAHAATAAEPAEPLPIDALFSLPNVRQPRLSPDGKKIAFLFPHEKKLALGIFDRATKESRMILRGQDESLYAFFWKGNDRIVFQADVSGNESFFIGSTDLTGKNVIRISESQRIDFNLTGDFAGIIDPMPLDPERIGVIGFFGGNVDNATFVGGAAIIGRINVRNRAVTPLFELRESDRFWNDAFLFDHRGALRIRARLEGRTLAWEHRRDESSPFKTIARHPFHGYAETWRPQSFAADNTTLWLVSREEHDRGALHAFNTETLERGPALFVPPAGEISDLVVTRDRARLLGVRYEAEREHYHWFDSRRGALQAKLENTFAGCDVRVTSWSDDETVALVFAAHDREPGAYYVLDQKAGSLELFKRTRNLDPTRLNPRRPIRYTARDGLEIHGYLTPPRAAAPRDQRTTDPGPGTSSTTLSSSAKRLPLIVHPHGGPFGIRDFWGFDGDAQFLASRGYAVLQPNYRGSGGYGREFIDKGRHQWGRAMQDDLTDGVKWAIEQGIADPERIAIYGASYGGYASLIGAMLTPDLYKCAVNYVGASDLEITFKQRGEDAWRTGDEFSYQTEWVGPTRAYRDETSPLNLVERIKIPTLHVYGAEDPRVKFDHWTRLEPLLKKHRKDYQAIVEGQQGHGFRDQEASISMYRALEIFLAKHLGGLKSPDAPAKKK